MDPDGSVWTGGLDSDWSTTIRQYDGNTGELLHEWEPGVALGDLDIGPDGRVLLQIGVEESPTTPRDRSDFSWYEPDGTDPVLAHDNPSASECDVNAGDCFGAIDEGFALSDGFVYQVRGHLTASYVAHRITLGESGSLQIYRAFDSGILPFWYVNDDIAAIPGEYVYFEGSNSRAGINQYSDAGAYLRSANFRGADLRGLAVGGPDPDSLYVGRNDRNNLTGALEGQMVEIRSAQDLNVLGYVTGPPGDSFDEILDVSARDGRLYVLDGVRDDTYGPVVSARVHVFGCGTTTSFWDVCGDHPFAHDIEWMAAQGISTGYADGTYRPAAAVTRQAMSAFMYRLAGEPAFGPPGVPTFSDVPTNHPFFDEIEWMAQENITTGYGDGGFHPGSTVTRQSMSAFMYRLAGRPAFAPGAPSFSDAPADHPFFDEIEWMANEGITTGYSNGTYRPSLAVSRQAMSAFMHRLADGPGVGI